jgi:C-terminal processing protease CtpA/Prc/tricorn protease-like protein
MKKYYVLILLLVVVNLYAYKPAFVRQPAISPAGTTVCFTYMSDLWIVDFTGGEAKRITVTDAEESNPSYSPCGEYIAFNSDRNGVNQIFVVPSEGGQARLVSEENLFVRDWFADGESLLAVGTEIGTRKVSMFRVPIQQQRPVMITEIGGHFCHLSKDNNKIIFSRKGYPYRPAYKGSMAGELWEYDLEKKEYTQLTFNTFTDRYPLYSHVNDYIYYAGSDKLRFQLYRAEDYKFEEPTQLTDFDTWSLRNPDIARMNDRIAFELFDKIWTYDPEGDKLKELEIEIKQDFLSSKDIREKAAKASEVFAISPDGKLIVFSYKYDLFAIPEKGGKVKQLTFDQAGIEHVEIVNNQSIYFVKHHEGKPQLFKTKITDLNNIEQIDVLKDKYINYLYKAEDKLMIHYELDEERMNVGILDCEKNSFKQIAEGYPIWSRFLAYSEDLNDLFFVIGNHVTWSRELYHYDVKKDVATPLFSSDKYIGNLYLGKDNQSLFLNHGNEIYRMDLLPIGDFDAEVDHWEEILADETKSKDTDVKKEFAISHEMIDQRLKPLVTSPGFNRVIHVESDSTLYYLNDHNSVRSIRKIDYHAKNDEEIISTSHQLESFVYNEKNDKLYYSDGQNLHVLDMNRKKIEPLQLEFDYEYNEHELNRSVFEQVWLEFGRGFYDPEMHGVDWDASFQRFSSFLDQVYTPNDLKYIIDEMIGEVNASHTGFYPRRDRDAQSLSAAYIGVLFDRNKLLDEGIELKEIYRNSTLAQKYGISSGDILVEVDGKKITPNTELGSLFLDKEGEKIELNILTESGFVDCEVKGLSAREQYRLHYDNWVSRRREIVDQLSNERIGYVHIPSMNRSSYNEFITEVFARCFDREALIIDIRDNGGGYIHDLLLDVLKQEYNALTTRRHYARDFVPSPRLVWDRPLALIINENSFSDAEIFPMLFKQAELGPVIGMPTSGSVIGTGSVRFMDGSSMRMPSTGWFTLKGENMEGTGAHPDIMVDLSPQEMIADDDVQLKRAVEEILKELAN